ncbi:class I SAM-dependent methyltransferase [Intestinimonas sp. MSJ-38]|uniref:class I SAM-dependent methyltransferase n=1 Tax=Intestinimonas sp. MSJ-38 TaxID=2841532 RepID=UPI001C10095E|nr:class I SAM-dependent methyltransferase [Intestinimonas sp. MSJ-38]MBU5432039.1 class I SAM-dependent methyltransferase [Intestinimonas sp. MSJ-38]
MVFSKRMEALADLCQGARRVIDVGCDHAQLCALLVTEYGVEHAFASDIRPGPLENARRTIAELGLESRITPVLSDGLDAFGPGDGDAVIIAGMGGEEMTLILSRAPWAGDNGGQVILQPMTNIPKLRQWLAENGYHVKKERVIKEGRKVYTAMNIQKGADESGAREYAYLFGTALLQDPLWPLYKEKLLTKYGASARGQEQAGLSDTPEQRIFRLLQNL